MPFYTDCITLDGLTTQQLEDMKPDTPTGTIARNSELNCLVYYDGIAWQKLTMTPMI